MWFKIFSQLSIGVTLFLSAGVGALYYVFKYDKGTHIENEIKSLEEEKSRVQKKKEDLKVQLQDLETTNKAMGLMGDEINKFMQYIPQTLTASKILKQLNAQARSAGVELEKVINHEFSEKQEFYEKLKITVTVNGFFTQIMVFLSKLTDLQNIITVERFTMEERDKKGGQEVVMEMDIYGYKYITPIIVKQEQKQEVPK